LYTGRLCEVLALGLTNSPSSGRGHSRHFLKLRQIIDIISDIVQD